MALIARRSFGPRRSRISCSLRRSSAGDREALDRGIPDEEIVQIIMRGTGAVEIVARQVLAAEKGEDVDDVIEERRAEVVRREGPTPAGGAYSEAIFIDGELVEIIEYDQRGRRIASTYPEPKS